VGDFGPGNVLKKSRKGTLAYIPVKNVVLGGEHSGRIIFNTINIELIPQRDSILGDIPPAEGDKTAVKIGRTYARRIVESARAVDPNADTETLRQLLTIGSWNDLDGLIFWAVVDIEPASNGYRAKNVIDRVITPADRDWPGSPSEPAVPNAAAAHRPRPRPQRRYPLLKLLLMRHGFDRADRQRPRQVRAVTIVEPTWRGSGGGRRADADAARGGL
jgi:hypothetical protein